MPISRRDFVALTGSALTAFAIAPACAMESAADQTFARVTARPKKGIKTTAAGRTRLGLGDARDGVLQMPTVVPDTPIPLLLLFHGASSSGERQLDRFGTIPSDAGVAVLALDSRGPTWDGIMGGAFGPDVAFINRALDKVFGQVAVDPARLIIGGFSDGASYALSMGLINGDVFPKVVAFSPGFLIPGDAQGKPRVFVSHGTADDVLPIDRCSRVIVPELKRRGYDVTFREFDGKHEVPAAVATEAFKWMA
jgi:phospholipase/carboxylesterase